MKSRRRPSSALPPHRRQWQASTGPGCCLSQFRRLSRLVAVHLLNSSLNAYPLFAFFLPSLARSCRRNSHTLRMPRRPCPTTSSRCLHFAFCHAAGNRVVCRLAGWNADYPLVRPQVLRLQYQKELSQSHVTVQTKFNYAWGLVKSPLREHQVEGVRLLQGADRCFCPLFRRC